MAMSDHNAAAAMERFFAALMIVATAWSVILYFTVSTHAALVAFAVASVALVFMHAIPTEDNSPPTADDLAGDNDV